MIRWAERLLLVIGLPAFLVLALVFPNGRAMQAWAYCWRNAGGDTWK